MATLRTCWVSLGLVAAFVMAGCAQEDGTMTSETSPEGSLGASSGAASTSPSKAPAPEPRELFNETRSGAVKIANPLVRDSCTGTLAACRASTLQKGTDHDVVGFESVPISATNVSFTLTWADDDAQNPATFDARAFDADGDEVALSYEFEGDVLVMRSTNEAAARLGGYQFLVWVHAGGGGTFDLVGRAWSD